MNTNQRMMKLGDRVEVKQGWGRVVGKDLLPNKVGQRWYVFLDWQNVGEDPYCFLESEIGKE